MNNNLLIVGANLRGVTAYEIARDMRCFEKIDFIDDEQKVTPNGFRVIGTMDNIGDLGVEYSNIIVAVNNPAIRLSLLKRIERETFYRIVTLISPKSYISPIVDIGKGCIIEPMAVIKADCVISFGCIVSTGAVVKDTTFCCEGVNIGNNAIIEGKCIVPVGTQIGDNKIYKKNDPIKAEDLFLCLWE
jgi:UDP-3-O-[3-hydroxymyristoyl] glucosamine N-acyltransferase